MTTNIQPEESRRIDLCFLASKHHPNILEELEKFRALAQSKGLLVAPNVVSFKKSGTLTTTTFTFYEQVVASSCYNVLVFDCDPSVRDRVAEQIELAKKKGRRVDFISELPLFGDTDGFPIDLSNYRTDGGTFFGEKAFLSYLDTLKREPLEQEPKEKEPRERE